MSDNPPIVFVTTTIDGHPDVDALRAIQKASIGDLGHVIHETGGPRNFIYEKIIDGYKKALDIPGIKDSGYIVLLHHDTVIEDRPLFLDLIHFVRSEGFALAGTRDGGTVIRGNENGKFYLNSNFIVVDPRAVGEWWEFDNWDGIYSYEDYWVLSRVAIGNIFYLETTWREPRIGKSTWALFRGEPVACHLWFSMGDLRASDIGFSTVEGYTAQQTREWRQEFLDHYGKRFGVAVPSGAN